MVRNLVGTAHSYTPLFPALSCAQAAAAAHAADTTRDSQEASASTSKLSPLAASKPASSALDSAAWKPSDKLSAYGSVSDASYASESYESRRQREEEEARERDAALEQKRREEGFVGEWTEVVPTARRHAVADVQTAAGEASEYQAAQSFKVREKSGRFGSLGDDGDEVGETQEVRVKKRRPNESEANWNEEASRRKRLPQWQSVKLETRREGSTSSDTASPSVNIKEERHARRTGEIKSEGGGKVQAATSPPQSDAGNQLLQNDAETPKSMFKKRKAGAGVGAKKVRAV